MGMVETSVNVPIHYSKGWKVLVLLERAKKGERWWNASRAGLKPGTYILK
jgi:hypothetical protein